MDFMTNSSVWQQSGMTMSLKNACAQYGVTQEQCSEANIPCQWRSCHGNSYAVVVGSDVRELSRRLKREAKEAKDKELKESLGEEGFEKYKKEKKEKAARNEQKPKIEALMKCMLEANATDSSVSIDGVKIATSVAKKTWGVDGELFTLEGETKGRSTVYNLEDVIKASLEMKREKGKYSSLIKAHVRHRAIVERLNKNDDDKAKNQYAAYYRKQLDGFMSDLVEEVATEMVEKAEKELASHQCRVRTLKEISGKFSTVLEDSTNKPRKSRKTARKSSPRKDKKPHIGMVIRKKFDDGEYYKGHVVSGPNKVVDDETEETVISWRVAYEDEEEEDLEVEELMQWASSS